MEHTKHIWRALIILLVMLVAGVLLRQFLIPKSFGMTGHFRHDSIGEYMAYPVIHGNNETCKRCHEEEYKTKAEGVHAPVPCETCHGPLFEHVDRGMKDKIADARVDKTYHLCETCHLRIASRPASFPQIVPLDHVNKFLAEQGLPPKKDIPSGICHLCHADPHSPGIE